MAGSALSLTSPSPLSLPGRLQVTLILLLCSYPGQHILNISAFRDTEVNFSSQSYKLCQEWALFGGRQPRFSGTPQPQGLAHVQTCDKPYMNVDLALWAGMLMALPGWCFSSWCFETRRVKSRLEGGTKQERPTSKEGVNAVRCLCRVPCGQTTGTFPELSKTLTLGIL